MSKYEERKERNKGYACFVCAVTITIEEGKKSWRLYLDGGRIES